MKRYEDYKSIEEMDWTRFKIVVPREEDKKELMEAFMYIHDSDVDCDYECINSLAHEYLEGNRIIVDEELFNKLNNGQTNG